MARSPIIEHVRLFILCALAIVFGGVMYGRRDQSYRMVGTWEAVDVLVPTTISYKEDGKCEWIEDGVIVERGKYAFRGSTLEVTTVGDRQALSEPEWHGEDSFTLNYIH